MLDVRLNNFRASGSILTGLCSVDLPRGRGDKMGTIFTMPAPKICDGKKIVQNFARFLTTFDFDREYLRNRSTYQKSEKLLKIYNQSHVGWKKFVYFGPQTRKLFSLINLHYNYTIHKLHYNYTIHNLHYNLAYTIQFPG